MAYENAEVIKRLFQRLFREEFPNLTQDERHAFEAQLEGRLENLLASAASNNAPVSFTDLIGAGPAGPQPFETMTVPRIRPDFDDSVIPSQLHAAAELYYIFQHEQMKVFSIVNVLRRLFQLGQLRIQRGPGARGLYLLEKWKPLRYSRRDRQIAYRRVFNYGTVATPAGAVVNRNFHFQLVAFMSAFAQYFRDLSISEVVKGGVSLTERPFGSAATIQRLGLDLRYALDRASYGNIVALSIETGQYLQEVLDLFDTPDIKRSFDANTKWDVVELAARRHLGGVVELSQRARMAESGRRILEYIAANDFSTTLDLNTFHAEGRVLAQHAESWIAAYRMTGDGRRFPGVARQLRWALGTEGRAAPGAAAPMPARAMA
jgi:hypothetical protein